MNASSILSDLMIIAQAPTNRGGDPAGNAAVQIQSIWDFIVKGGPMMIPIVLCSFIALTVIIERLISLRRSVVIPPGFRPDLEQLLGDRDKALDYCNQNASPVAEIFAAAIKKTNHPIEVLDRSVKDAGRRVIIRLRKYLRALAVIASISPLMGLLGTIFGMINAFQTVASSGEALGKTELLAEGIYEAMITTAAGLLVAIPVLVAYHWIFSRTDGLVLDIDRMIVDFVDEQTHRQRPGSAGEPEARLAGAVEAA